MNTSGSISARRQFAARLYPTELIRLLQIISHAITAVLEQLCKRLLPYIVESGDHILPNN